jgi:hypothetical protein
MRVLAAGVEEVTTTRECTLECEIARGMKGTGAHIGILAQGGVTNGVETSLESVWCMDNDLLPTDSRSPPCGGKAVS